MTGLELFFTLRLMPLVSVFFPPVFRPPTWPEAVFQGLGRFTEARLAGVGFTKPRLAPPGIAEPRLPEIGLAEALFSATPIVQLTFLILLVLSIVSWAVIFQKWVLFRKVREEDKDLKDVFLKYSSFKDIYRLARSRELSPLARIFSAGYEEMIKVFRPENSQAARKGEENIERALRKEAQVELSSLESGLVFLATAGAACPFIGLFGTVFGIMDAFGKIAATGSAGLSVVAPGIAEALLATGLGLFAAIPASVFYNIYVNRLQDAEREYDNFSTDFINIACRNFFIKK